MTRKDCSKLSSKNRPDWCIKKLSLGLLLSSYRFFFSVERYIFINIVCVLHDTASCLLNRISVAWKVTLLVLVWIVSLLLVLVKITCEHWCSLHGGVSTVKNPSWRINLSMRYTNVLLCSTLNYANYTVQICLRIMKTLR